MILKLKAENFKSVNDEILFSMAKTQVKEHSESLLKITENLSAVSVGAIFGKNASGKTTILEIIGHMSNMIVNFNKYKPEMNIPFKPFKFTNKIRNESKFELLFFYNETPYLYKFIQTRNEILEESLYHFRNLKQALIFERKKNQDYKFGRDYLRLKGLKDRVHNNRLFLSIAAEWSPEIEDIMNPFNYFSKNIDFNIEGLLFPKSSNFSKNWTKYTTDLIHDNSKAKEFFLRLMKKLNTDITGIEIKKDKISKEILNKLPEELQMLMKLNTEEPEAISTKIVYNLGGINYFVEISQESQGVQKIFQLTGMLFDALEFGKLIIFDEIEMGLHPIVVREIIKIFKNNKINKNKAQLIFTTHDQTLCDLTLFRRDEIFFTKRFDIHKNLGTNVFRLSDIPNVRITENIQKGYMDGKYTTIPNISDEEIWI